MPKPSREPRGRKNEWESLPESKSEVESYLNNRKETPKQPEQKYVWSYLPESLQEIEDRRQKQYQDLQAQRANIIPTATGNMDAEYAGYNKALAEYGSYWGDKAAYSKAQSDYWDAAKTEQPGHYYAQTMSADEVDKRLEELRATKEKVHENLMRVLSDIDNNPHTQEERLQLSDTKYRIQDRYTKINNEIDYLETAKGLHKQRRGNEMYNYWLNEGGLEQPENYAKVEQGKAKYEADRLTASGGMKEPEIATPAGGAIKAYRDRNQKENEWDSIFDNAPNLTPSDEMVFYALYADDPEQAMEWAYYINNRRNSEFQGEIAAWGKEHPIPAWFGGLGSRMISGVANIVDQNSAFAQKQSLQSTGWLSGGAQALNEWSGTIDTDIPIIKDLFNGKGAGDFYQLASSIVESGINMAVASYTGDAAKLVGALGTFIMGSSAAAADYNESLQRGLTTAQAQRHALAAGINEAAFEFISLDKVIKADKLAGQLKKVFVDAGIEASEEFCTTVANRVADGYLARTDGYDTQIEQRTKELIALGLSRAEAEAQAEREWRVELINDAIGGFISGGFHSGIEWGGGKVANKIATNQYNETAGIMTNADEIAALQAYADENGIKYNEKALRGMEAVETEESGPQSAVPTTENGGQQTTVSTETRDADSSSTAQNDNGETTEKKQSRREARQERKSNRATGALQTQVEAHIAKAAHESGLNNAQAFFEQTVSRYGEGITRTAQNAVAHEARTVFGQASSQAELTDLYQKALDGVTAHPVKQALQKVYNEGTAYLYKQGDEGAKNRLIQQIGNTGKQFNTTVVLQNEDGTERSAKITDVLPGAERVKLDSGETVAVSDLAGIDADTKDILDMIGRLEIGSAADMLWKSFKVEAGSRTNSENSRYILDWTQAFDQGRTNTITMEEAVRRSSLDKATVEQAYKLGQQERATMDKAKEERLAKAREQAKKGFTGKNGILDDTGVSKHALDRAMQNDPTLKEQIKMAEVIAKALGVDVKLFNSFDNETWHGTENGSYNAATNTIMLDINAGKTAASDFTSGLLAVCGHELTHWMETFAFEAYGKYKDAVVQYIVKAYGKDGLSKLIHEQQERNQNLSRDEAIDEIVADASMDRMGDKSFWQAVSENLGEDRAEVRGKIAQFFDKYLGKIKEALRTKQVFMSRVNVARLEKQMQDALSALYAEGIREAAKNRKALTGTATEKKNSTMQAAPAVKTFNKNNELFSMRSPVEQTDRLIAWHNMSDEALRSALELGGLAMPSWAIKTADKAHTSYGDISVIAPRSLVDPKMNRNSMIFGGDAWTPVFPDVNYKISSDAVDALTDEIEGLIGKDALRDLGGASLDETNIADQFSKNGGAVSNYYKRNQALRYAYLKSIGQDIELPKTAKRLDDSGKYENEAVENFISRLVYGKKSLDYYRSMTGKEIMQEQDLKQAITDTMVTMYGEEVRDAYAPDELSFRDIDAMLYAANKYFREGIREEIDSRAVGKEIDKVIDEAAYEKWIGEKLNATIERKGIRNNKDLFTPSGKRRSFDELNYAYNLANIVKAMKAQPKQGRTQFLSGPGSVKGAALKNYSTVEQVRADSSRLVNTAEEGKAAYDAYNDNLADILDRMSKTGDRFDTADAMIEILQHAKTEDAIYRYMERELKDWYNVSRELAHDIYKLIGQINELPMEYFEGKTYDAVSFNETAAVVVPDTISADLKQQLIDAGANVIEYKAGDNEDRLAKVNSAENVQFSTRDTSLPSDLELALSAADEIVAGGGDEYWASLLESDPGIAGEAEEIKRLGKQLKKTEADLVEARRNLTLTDRKLKTRGIASLAATIMQDQKAGDVNHNDVQKRITSVLTEAYQKALDQLDAGADVSDAWETVYQEGVVKAADILLRDATHSEKISYKWYTKALGEYLGEGAREYVEADVAARVAQDFDANRYRPGQKATVADRLVAQAENRVNKKLDVAKTENAALKAENAKLSEDKAFYKEQAETAKATAGELYQQLLDKREELKNNKKISADERKATLKKLDNMTRQMQAKRREAEVWKSKSEIGWKAANKAVQEKQAAVDKLEKQLQREQDILSGKLKPPAIQKMLKAAREREAERVAQHKDERFAKYKEGKKASDLRKRIKNLSDDMKRTMVKPTDGSYVPASLYGSMTKLADALDDFLAPNDGTKAASRYRAVMDKIHALSSEYQAVATLDDPVYSSEYDEEIQHEINELVRTLQGANADEVGTINMTPAKARELSVDELQKVYDIMKYINYCMKTAKSMMASGTFRSVYDAMGQIAEQQQSMTSLNRLGWSSKKKRLRMLDSLSVMRAVEMMSSWERSAALYQLMQQIENGVDVSNSWVMEYNKALQTLKTGKNEKAYRDALTKKLDYSVTDEEGLPVLMTKMQALQLLMTAEREAHNDKLVHLQKGGATIRDALAIQDGKKNVKSQNIKVTPELIQRIQDSLSEWDKAYMKTVRDYFQREGKTTNSVMYKLKHRVLQTEEYYTPYVVDKNYLDTNLDEKQAMSMWVKAPGSTKPLETEASQPVIIDGMDTVMAKHVREIADYIGLALPIRDFSKVYNGRLKQGEGEKPLPVKQTIGKNFGEKGQHLLTQSIIDVQGGSRSASWSTAIAEHLNALQSAFVKSALLVNPSVTIKQAASYVAAGSILSHTALDRANHPISVKTDESHSFDPATGLIGHIFFAPNGATATRIYNEIDKHTSLHYQRRLGMSQAELANEANRSGKVRRAMNSVGASMEQNVFGHAARKVGASLNPVSWIQRMDVATTATLWLACKEQARMDGMKVGTEEYWNHVTELYERVIRETQPMYDSLHRNAGQKSRENSLMQYLFPFRTVPIQNHGQIAASYETLQTALKSKDEARIKEAKKFFAKTMWAQTESAVIFSLMSFIAAALKRKTKKYRDEDEEISLASILEGIGRDTAGTMVSNFFPLFGSTIWDELGNIYDAARTGKKVWSYDTFSVGTVDMMNDFAKASWAMISDAFNWIAGNDVTWDKFSKDAENLVVKSLKCIGFPSSTIKTYVEGFVGNLKDVPYLFSEGRIPALNDASWERSAAVNANRYLKAWIADDDAKLETVKAEMMGNYAAAGKNEEDANKAMKTKLTATAKDAFVAGTLDMTDAILFLAETGYYDEDKAWLKVKEWKAENEHADDDDYSWSKYEDLYAAMDSDGDIEPYRDELIDHGVKADTINNAVVDHVKERYEEGEIDADEAMRLLQKYKGMSENDAYWKVDAWDAKEEAEANGEKTTNSNYRDLYAAIDANVDASAAINELTAHGYKERDVYSAAKDHLVERFEKGEINETQFKNQLSRYAKIVKQEDVDPIVNNAKCYKETGYRLGSLNESYLDGEITAEKFKQIRVKYGGKTAEEAKKQIRWLDLKKANPNLEITESVSNNWYDGTTKSRENGHESAKAAGMSIEAYLKAKATLDAIKDSNDNGTGEDEVIAAIAKMNLTARQKDALYYERYKGGARKGIYKTW